MQYRNYLLLILLLGVGCAEQQNKPVSTKRQPVVAPVGVNGLDGNEEQAILSYHNEVRANVGVAPLIWSPELAQHAANWIATLASQGCSLQHAQKSNDGENLFMSPASQDDNHQAVVEAAKAWESEKINYSGEALNKANWSQAGHYTQMVWRDTHQLGCAKIICGEQQVIVACNYNPAGNQLGEKPY